MRVIPVNVHNILDYIYGVLLIASPWLFGFSGRGPETYVPVAAGIVVIVISLLTNYKYSIAKVIAFNAHLILEFIIGIFTALSPWIFGFSNFVFVPHVVSGTIIVAVSLMSKRFVNYISYD